MSDNIPAQSAWAELKNMFAPRHKFLVDHLDAKRRLGEATLRIYQQTEPTRNIHPLSHAAKDLLLLTLHRVYARVWEITHRKKPCKGAPPSEPLLTLHLEDPAKVTGIIAPDEFAAAMRLVSVRGLAIDVRTKRVTTPLASSQSAKDHGMATTGMSTEMPLFVTFAKGMLQRYDIKTSAVFPYYLLASSSYLYSDKAADAALALFSPSLSPEKRADMIAFMRKNDELVFASTEQWQIKYGDEWIILAAQMEVDLPKRPCDLPLARMGVPAPGAPVAVLSTPPNAELAPATPPRTASAPVVAAAPAPPQRAPTATADPKASEGEATEDTSEAADASGDESAVSGSEEESSEPEEAASEEAGSAPGSNPSGVDKDIVNALENRRKAVAGTNEDDGSVNETDPIASKYKMLAGPYRHHHSKHNHGAPPKSGHAFYNYMEHAKDVKHAGTQLIGPKRGANVLDVAEEFFNPLAGNRWEQLFSDPEAAEKTVIIGKVKVIRSGKYLPTTRALLSNGAVYRFMVSWVDDKPGDVQAESLSFESPHRLLDKNYGRPKTGISSWGTTRTADRAFILGRLLTEAGIIASGLDAWAQAFLQSDAFKTKMAEYEAEEAEEQAEYEKQRVEREQKAKLDAAAAAKRSAAAKKAAITRANKKAAATVPATPAPAASSSGTPDIEARVRSKRERVQRYEQSIAELKKKINDRKFSALRDDRGMELWQAQLQELERDLEDEKEELYELESKVV